MNNLKKYNEMKYFYTTVFQDVHVMIFIGFGFLMTFLKRYGFSAIGLNMMISAFCIQWSMLIGGFIYFLEGHSGRFPISIETLVMLYYSCNNLKWIFSLFL